MEAKPNFTEKIWHYKKLKKVLKSLRMILQIEYDNIESITKFKKVLELFCRCNLTLLKV